MDNWSGGPKPLSLQSTARGSRDKASCRDGVGWRRGSERPGSQVRSQWMYLPPGRVPDLVALLGGKDLCTSSFWLAAACLGCYYNIQSKFLLRRQIMLTIQLRMCTLYKTSCKNASVG